MTNRALGFRLSILFICLLPSLAALAQPPVKFDAATVSGLPARNIGSATMSGRVAAVDGVNESGQLTIFVGTASGGVWKSVNGGTTFKPVFDRQPVQSIGAVAIDPSNHKIVWAGTGESWVRNSVSVGDGVLQVHRRRRELGQRGAKGFRAHCQDPRGPQGWQQRPGVRYRPLVERQRGARRL